MGRGFRSRDIGSEGMSASRDWALRPPLCWAPGVVLSSSTIFCTCLEGNTSQSSAPQANMLSRDYRALLLAATVLLTLCAYTHRRLLSFPRSLFRETNREGNAANVLNATLEVRDHAGRRHTSTDLSNSSIPSLHCQRARNGALMDSARQHLQVTLIYRFLSKSIGQRSGWICSSIPVLSKRKVPRRLGWRTSDC